MFFLLYRPEKDIDKIVDFFSPKSNCLAAFARRLQISEGNYRNYVIGLIK